MVGLVHVENEITVHRALTADDLLEITVHADNLAPHAKGRTVQLVTEVDVDGARVWEGRSTYLARGKGETDAPSGDRPPAMPSGFPAAQWSLAADLGREYAAVSGDVNPIHLSALTAKATGFPKAIAHGMWSYARVMAALGRHASGPVTSTCGSKADPAAEQGGPRGGHHRHPERRGAAQRAPTRRRALGVDRQLTGPSPKAFW